MKTDKFNLQFSFNTRWLSKLGVFINRHLMIFLLAGLTIISIYYFIFFWLNGLGIAYNDARSHLDIARRVVEGLKPGVAQLGSVWLPLPHVLMVPTIWSDFMWHTGLSGAIVSMISFIATGILIYLLLKEIGAGIWGRLAGVLFFALNLNVLYLQSTAMTELLSIVTTTAASYYLLVWCKKGAIVNLLKAAFYTMLATLTRYDGWFLLLLMGGLVIFETLRKKDYKTTEGIVILFSTLAGFGVVLWFLWNQLIFKDALYFAFGPFSARTQQEQLEVAGNLVTKGNIGLSLKIYLYALLYNVGTFNAVIGFVGAFIFWFSKRITTSIKVASLALTAPLLFNILALYLGHSVLFIQGISGNTWFNVRYGILVIPFVAVFIGFLIDYLKPLRVILVSLLLFVMFFSFHSFDAVTIDDARVGSSQKNVTEVSSWLSTNARDQEGFILISAASHDAIIFSSGLPMSRFIHEGTGNYWQYATTNPQRWARWIIMRTYDNSDLTYKAVSKTPDLASYELVGKYPFADIYQLKKEYLATLITKPILGKQK